MSTKSHSSSSKQMWITTFRWSKANFKQFGTPWETSWAQMISKRRAKCLTMSKRWSGRFRQSIWLLSVWEIWIRRSLLWIWNKTWLAYSRTRQAQWPLLMTKRSRLCANLSKFKANSWFLFCPSCWQTYENCQMIWKTWKEWHLHLTWSAKFLNLWARGPH